MTVQMREQLKEQLRVKEKLASSFYCHIADVEGKRVLIIE